MRFITKIKAMQRLGRQWQREGRAVVFVPTMGFLHPGHASLMTRARRLAGSAGKVVASVYVNPAQFGPKEDYSKYPRDLARDRRICHEAGVDVVFAPVDGEIYPAGFSTFIVEEKLTEGMEGASRPGHFRGVTTIVAKLFNIVLPTTAVFGAKDFQQAAVLKRLTRDLNFPLKIVVAPTLREPDGLAMSSRNKYLSPVQRQQATALWRAIKLARKAAGSGPVPVAPLKRAVAALLADEPETRLDYVEFFDPESLQPVKTVAAGTQMALAVWVGRTRLIDNARL